MGWRFRIGGLDISSNKINAIKKIKQGVEDGTIQDDIERIKTASISGAFSSNPIGLAIIGIVILVIGIFFFKTMPASNSNYEKVVGEVIDIEEKRDTDGNYMYTPEIKYEVDGKIYEELLSESSSSSKYFTGDEIEVYYKIDNPTHIKTNSMMFPLIFSGIGGLLTVLGVVAIFNRR